MNKEELNKKIEALKEEQEILLEALKEYEKETWFPESFVPSERQLFCFLDADNDVRYTNFASSNKSDHFRIDSGNCFRTLDCAERMAEINLEVIEFKRYVKDLNGDWTPNWKDATDKKFIIYYREENKEFLCSSFSYNYYFNVVLESAEIANKIIEKYGDKLHYLLKLAR